MNSDVNNSCWLATHGLQDSILPFHSSKSQIKLLQNAGFDIDFKAYNKEHNIEAEELEMIAQWIKQR